jgi:hypothetical protein
MAYSPFTLLRNADGRSLAKALACLLLINVVVAGFHAGMATAGTGGVICSVAADSAAGGGGGPVTPADEDHSCCLIGCTPAPVLIAAAPEALPTPAIATLPVQSITAPAARPLSSRMAAHRPRGPPVLA